MTTLKSIVTMLCLVSVTVGVLVLIGDAHRTLAHADKVLITANGSIDSTSKQLSASIAEATDAIQEVKETAQIAKQSAAQSQKYYVQLGKQANDIERDSRIILAHIDRRTLPGLDAAIASASKDIDATSNALVSASSGISRDADSLNALIANPQNVELVQRLDLAALHLDEATAHGNDVLAHFDHVAGYYDARLTSPRGFVKTLGKGLLQLVTPASNVAIAIK